MSFSRIIVGIFIISVIAFSCKKDSFITSPQAQLSTSVDSLLFDTVFTSAGSVTKTFKIFNNNNQKLKLSKVKLMGGSASSFKVNIDGIAAPEVNDIEVAANDSIYVFVQVNVNPTAANLPFILSDSILINYNGNERFVQLQAYGQNAIFLNKQKISADETWDNTLPYVILGGLEIAEGTTLTIQEGTKIYLHADAPILVDGSLQAVGTKDANVIFRGDRMDADYKDLPAAWPGIYFRNASMDNVLKFVQVLNSYQAVVVQNQANNASPKLTLSQSVIDNAYDVGLLGINTTIDADNCLIKNCGQNIVLIIGDYNFTHCTAATYSNYYISHKYPVLQATNTAENIVAPLNANFTNCIFWGEGGNMNSEISVVIKGTNPALVFDHVLFKGSDPSNSTFTVPAVKQDPLFDSINISRKIFDFHLQANSPAIDKGKSTFYNRDLDDKLRINLPDLGCYEKN